MSLDAAIPLPGGTSIPVVRALDNVVGCRPEAHLVLVEVPEHPGTLALRLEDGRVEVGEVPGQDQDFVPRDSVKVRGLRLRWMRIGVKASLRARVWSIGASRGRP